MNTEIQCNLNGIIVSFNESFKENMKELLDFMEITVTEYNDLKMSIENNLAMMKNSKSKRVNKKQLLKASAKTRTRNQCKNDISERNSKNILEENFIDISDSIACRTRGAMKAIRDSKLNITNNFNDVTKTVKGIGRVKGKVSKVNIENNNVNNKRSAEEEADVYDVSLKKIRQENLSNYELSKNEERVFKKPLNRGRLKGKKTNDSVKNTNSDTLAEDFQFFNNPIVHSSPNASVDLKGSRTFVVSPNSISNIKASPKQDSSTSSLGIPSVKEKVAAFERMGSEVALNSKEFKQNSKTSNFNEKITDIDQKPNKECNFEVKNSDEFVSSASVKKKEKLQTEEFETDRISLKNLDSNLASTPKEQVIKKLVSKSSNGNEKNTIIEGGLIRSSSSINYENDVSKDGEIMKSKLCQTRTIHEKNSKCEIFPNEEIGKASLKTDLNATKKITKASKRTKPVLKPKIFDSMGNIIVKNVKKSDEPVITAPKKNSSEKSYDLRSSTNILCTTSKKDSKIKKEVDDDDALTHINLLSMPERESNEENKPQSGGKKKTKTTKKKCENAEIRKDKESESISTDRIVNSKKGQEQRKSTAPNSGLIMLARKSLKKAKRISFHQNKLKSLQGFTSRVTPQKTENHLRSTSKSHLVTPLHTITNNIMKPCTQTKMAKIVYPKYYENTMSTGKGKYILDQLREREMLILNKVGPALENSLKSASKNTKENELQKEIKLKIIKEKEEEASMKREQAIKSRREELKRKNEMKLQSAMKQRKKLEEVKYNNIIQIEKQKEAKHKQLLEERDKKLKERALRKKQLMEQKLAETEERRRLEEEARIAKLKEQEAEQERLMREKQKELERHEKRAQERMAQEKAKEQYELNLKLEQMKAEKILAAKAAAQVQNTNKVAKSIPKANSAWNYKPRNENDYGLEDENSELDSDCEEPPASNRPLPLWAKRVKNKEYRLGICITQDLLMEYMPNYQKTPDIHKMFKMTPNKRIKRTSSAIWNTPSS